MNSIKYTSCFHSSEWISVLTYWIMLPDLKFGYFTGLWQSRSAGRDRKKWSLPTGMTSVKLYKSHLYLVRLRELSKVGYLLFHFQKLTVQTSVLDDQVLSQKLSHNIQFIPNTNEATISFQSSPQAEKLVALHRVYSLSMTVKTPWTVGYYTNNDKNVLPKNTTQMGVLPFSITSDGFCTVLLTVLQIEAPWNNEHLK